MAGDRQTLIFWGAELDGAFRRRLERELATLNVRFADASGVDPDPDGPAPVRLAVQSTASEAPPKDLDLVVLVGAGAVREPFGALHLDTADIENRTRRWMAFVEKLGKKLERASLTVAPENLEVLLDEATRRADEAERARAEFERERNDALRAAKQAEALLAAERARVAGLEHAAERLEALSESTAFALSSVPGHIRDVVNTAREHAWRARLVAARASDAADMHPDALAFPKAHAIYSGETRNRVPHGFGVIVFSEGGREIARYAGAFKDGQRMGHGIATSDGGHVWSGQWRDNEACGYGLLEAPDGTRFEGEAAPDPSGAPKEVSGHVWPGAGAQKAARLQTHRPIAPALPPPAGQAAGG